MRYQIISTLTFGLMGLASAASTTTTSAASSTTGSAVSLYPECAQSCLTKAIESSGCGASDSTCQCTSGLSTILKDGLTCLLTSSCSAADVQTVEKVAIEVCESALAAASLTGAASSSAYAEISSAAAVAGFTDAATTSASGSAATSTGSASATGSSSATGTSSASSTAAAATGGAAFANADKFIMGAGLLAVLAL